MINFSPSTSGDDPDPKKPLRDFVVRVEVAGPDLLPGLQLEATRLAGHAEGVNVVAIDHRTAAGPVAVSVPILILHRVGMPPKQFPGGGIPALHHLLVPRR